MYPFNCTGDKLSLFFVVFIEVRIPLIWWFTSFGWCSSFIWQPMILLAAGFPPMLCFHPLGSFLVVFLSMSLLGLPVLLFELPSFFIPRDVAVLFTREINKTKTFFGYSSRIVRDFIRSSAIWTSFFLLATFVFAPRCRLKLFSTPLLLFIGIILLGARL